MKTLIAPAAALLAVALFAAAIVLAPRPAAANPTYAQQTGKQCTFCHTQPPALNTQGKSFQAHGHKL